MWWVNNNCSSVYFIGFVSILYWKMSFVFYLHLFIEILLKNQYLIDNINVKYTCTYREEVLSQVTTSHTSCYLKLWFFFDLF